MENRIIRIEDKIDIIKDTMSEINSTLAAQHVSLDDHIRRTALLEAEVAPIKAKVHMIHGVFKFIGFIAVIAAIAEGAAAVITLFLTK